MGGELVQLVKLAEDRGVSVEGTFRHFDPRGTGLVDGEALCSGLARLGIGISDAAAEVLVSQISRDTSGGGGSMFFRASDLQAFVHNELIDERLLDELEASQPGDGGDNDDDLASHAAGSEYGEFGGGGGGQRRPATRTVA